MTHPRKVLVLSHRDAERVASSVRRIGAQAIVTHDVEEALTMLRGGAPVRAVVADSSIPGFHTVLRVLREEPRLHGVPILVIVEDATTPSFVNAHALGADGVIVAGMWEELTECLKSLLSGHVDPRVPVVHGSVVVAHPDVTTRRALARGLRRLGFGVTFAADQVELDDRVRDDDSLAAIVCPGLVTSWPSFALHGRPTVALASPHELRSLKDAIRDVSIVRAVPASTNAAALVFQLGELLKPGIENSRASRRLLSSTLCTFREAGTRHARHGLTHNLSLEGMYVCAVAPPKPGSALWLELAPPGDTDIVHLRAEVVWRRGPTPTPAGGPVPPGFGARISVEDSPRRDLVAYRDAYHRLADSLLSDEGAIAEVDAA